MTGPYALKQPNGVILWQTVAATKDDVWGIAFTQMPQVFRDRYWKRWDASIAAAKRAGYQFVPVTVVERK